MGGDVLDGAWEVEAGVLPAAEDRLVAPEVAAAPVRRVEIAGSHRPPHSERLSSEPVDLSARRSGGASGSPGGGGEASGASGAS